MQLSFCKWNLLESAGKSDRFVDQFLSNFVIKWAYAVMNCLVVVVVICRLLLTTVLKIKISNSIQRLIMVPSRFRSKDNQMSINSMLFMSTELFLKYVYAHKNILLQDSWTYVLGQNKYGNFWQIFIFEKLEYIEMPYSEKSVSFQFKFLRDRPF